MSYSQWKQDSWLNENIFKNLQNGFFVDVGAHDGIEINNTLFFEKELNWRGICIEPIPNIYNKLLKNRKAICINGCIFNKNSIIEFNIIEGYSEMLSGINSSYSKEHLERIDREIKEYGGKRRSLYINSYTLENIFDIYNVKHVNYLTIDTEGSELQVLQGINFNKVTIDVIEVEVNYKNDEEKITEFLKKNYDFLIKLGGDNIYIKK